MVCCPRHTALNQNKHTEPNIMKILAPNRNYIAIIDNDEAHPIDLRARDAADAKKQARRYMSDVVGHSVKYEGPYKLNVRLATPDAPDAED